MPGVSALPASGPGPRRDRPGLARLRGDGAGLQIDAEPSARRSRQAAASLAVRPHGSAYHRAEQRALRRHECRSQRAVRGPRSPTGSRPRPRRSRAAPGPAAAAWPTAASPHLHGVGAGRVTAVSVGATLDEAARGSALALAYGHRDSPRRRFERIALGRWTRRRGRTVPRMGQPRAPASRCRGASKTRTARDGRRVPGGDPREDRPRPVGRCAQGAVRGRWCSHRETVDLGIRAGGAWRASGVRRAPTRWHTDRCAREHPGRAVTSRRGGRRSIDEPPTALRGPPSAEAMVTASTRSEAASNARPSLAPAAPGSPPRRPSSVAPHAAA